MLRIVGGSLRGRLIATPRGTRTRPTSDKVRESIFNVLQSLVFLEGCAVLDLYAGSGALGIEALSRGASRAVFVESHRKTAEGIKITLNGLGLGPEQATVVTARAETWLARPTEGKSGGSPALLVLMDPPYRFGGEEALLEAVAASPAAAPGALVVMESARETRLASPPGLDPVRSKRYGDTLISFFKKGAA